MSQRYEGAEIAPPFKGNCHRCSKETDSFTMSWFSTESICMECSDEENDHADIKLAKDVEIAHVKAGNFNYPGIGWPGKDNRLLIDISALYPSTVLPIEEE
jgi:hypothetical protein